MILLKNKLPHNMAKTNLYFVPGMAANSKIFENLSLDTELFNCYFLEWKIPTSEEESLSDYARRMCEEIIHENPVLIGVSFGGVIVQEMSKLIKTQKIIIISSIKMNCELPKRLKIVQQTKIYNLFPSKFLENFENYVQFFIGDRQSKKLEAYQKYLSFRNQAYLHWAIHSLLHWEQETPINNLVHIHGTKDEIFPIIHIQGCISVESGTHAMVLTKAKKISLLIAKSLIC